MGLFDGFFYSIEQHAASRSIPSISDVSCHRISLRDFPLDPTRVSFDHSNWNALLQHYVSVRSGSIGAVADISTVDYDGMANDERFAAYLEQLSACDPTKLQVAEQLAFWMNAYNALCINLIVKKEQSTGTHINSINDLSTSVKKVWDMDAGVIHGKQISLNQIEHYELRRRFNEPRVHACIVCASASCPNLRNEAFRPEALNEQMDDQMKDWMSNPTKGIRWNPDERKIELSRIFLWFAADFGDVKGVRALAKLYVEADNGCLKGKLEEQAPVRYFNYSWQINRSTSKETYPVPPPEAAAKKYEL